MEALYKLADSKMCQVLTCTGIDEAGTVVGSYQLGDTRGSFLDLYPETTNCFIVLDFGKFWKGFIDILEGKDELPGGPFAGV
jgi:hypothetical protein